MGRSELERLSREELIELVLRLQRPEKTSRTSSKPPGKRSLAGALRDKILDLDTVLSRRPVSALCLDLRSRPISS